MLKNDVIKSGFPDIYFAIYPDIYIVILTLQHQGTLRQLLTLREKKTRAIRVFLTYCVLHLYNGRLKVFLPPITSGGTAFYKA